MADTNDLIRREDAMMAVAERINQIGYNHNPLVLSIMQAIVDVPSEQTSRIEKILHGKSPKEQFKIIERIFVTGKYWTECVDYLREYGNSPCDAIDDRIEVTAWMPLPEPYKEEPSGNSGKLEE